MKKTTDQLFIRRVDRFLSLSFTHKTKLSKSLTHKAEDSVFSVTKPSNAAEHLYFSYPALIRSIVVFYQGPVLKFNGNQRYATTAITASILRSVAEKSQVPLQVSHVEQQIINRLHSSCKFFTIFNSSAGILCAK